MTTSTISGTNYGLDGSRIRFFDSIGMHFSNERWGFNGLGGSTLIECDPTSIRPSIRDALALDGLNGKLDEVAMLVLGSRDALIFYLEGGMTPQHLSEATETDGHIDIPGVSVEGRELVVRVIGDADYGVATANADGEIV